LDLLRRSGDHSGTDYGLDGNGGSGVGHEKELLAFVDAAIIGTTGEIAQARAAVEAGLGSEAVIDAAAVIAGFDAITRVADGTGIPLEPPKAEASADWRARLGIDDYWTAKV
jgi:alkylhydroperoxidase family enzyme